MIQINADRKPLSDTGIMVKISCNISIPSCKLQNNAYIRYAPTSKIIAPSISIIPSSSFLPIDLLITPMYQQTDQSSQ